MLDHSHILDRWYRYIAFLGVTLAIYQATLAEELLKFPIDAKVKQARQTGKSFIMGLLIFFIAYELKWNIIITAPVLDQTKGIMKWVHAAKKVTDYKMRLQGKGRLRLDADNRYEIILSGRGSITAVSGSESANVESKSADLVVVDEHQDLELARVSEVFGNMLAGSILFHSERTGGLTPFWSCGIGGERLSVAERVGCDFDWELPWQRVLEILIETNREADAEKYTEFIAKQRRDMFPEEFAAHHECKRLDTSEKLLIPDIYPYTEIPEGTLITIGFDFGRSVDKTIGTALHHFGEWGHDAEMFFIEQWLIEQGSFDLQHDLVCDWLRSEGLIWDNIKAEVNGIGHGPTDFLSREFPETEGITVNTRWKTRNCQKVARMAASKRLLYNPEHKYTGSFLKDITSLKYKMTNTSEISVDHSDFLSSLLISVDEPKFGSVAA